MMAGHDKLTGPSENGISIELQNALAKETAVKHHDSL